MDTRAAGQPKVLIDIDPKLKQKMRETLDALAQYLLQKKPEDPVKSIIVTLTRIQIPYMVQFFEDCKGIGAAPLSVEERIELQELRRTALELRAKVAQQVEGKKKKVL